jgi:hypothetical protein
MLVAYFDEVKHEKGRPFYWLGALVADAKQIWQLEQQLNALAEAVFESRSMTKATEFHASDILNGNKHCKDWSFEKRVDTLKRLTSIIGTTESLGKVYVKIYVDRVKYGIDVEETAFKFMVERIDNYLKAKSSPGMLIGDRENEAIAGKMAMKLSCYREDGTNWYFGKKIEFLIDTVHFTHSHHSRMLQLADLHVYLRQLVASGAHGNKGREAVINHVRSIEGCLSPNHYKEWPPE